MCYNYSVRVVIFLLIFASLLGTAQASVSATPEANFWTEFDITFFQTLPFAAFWGYAIGTQLSGGGAVDWGVILTAAGAVSAGNAYFHARRVTAR